MTTLDGYYDSLLTETIDILESNEPLRNGEHDNFFIDLGWDVVSGDGSLSPYAEEVLNASLSELNPLVMEWLWWQGVDGSVEATIIKGALEETPPDFRGVDSEYPQMQGQVLKALLERLLERAEAAYTAYEEAYYSDDDHDGDTFTQREMPL